ncbi:MAG TPA: hypothetical protein VLU41_01235, partial [Ideonella sp.]|nr:hypothetical protein [Ideonella sp.]
LLASALVLGSGCTTALVVAHVHRQLTEGDPTPCVLLNSVQRALEPRCGAFVPGSLRAADVAASGLPVCPLALAARDPRLWPVLPELLARGAAPETCDEAPLAALAQAHPCPDFAAAAPAELRSLRWLAEADARAVQHDVVRLLSCPSARAVHLDTVLDGWLAQGLLPADNSLTFAPLAALHPSALATPLAGKLEAAGHRARDSLGGYAGRLGPGFDTALRTGDWAALDWWLARVPELADRVPPTRPNQLPWLPLAQVLTPGYLDAPMQQADLVRYLLAHGADPWLTLPHEPGRTVVAYAQSLGSPLAPLLAAAHPAAPSYAARRGAPVATLMPTALRLAQ